MTHLNFIRCLLVISHIFIFSSMSFAEQTALSDDLKLTIPVLKFQQQYLWAELEYSDSSNESIKFKVNGYGALTEQEVPPELSNLANVTSGADPEIVDIKADEARLTFISSIPLACSVVYGKTPEFGAVALDASMNGGAIIDHNPVLTQLEPETVYYYRVQGADASGKLYWAATESFTTAAEDLSDNNLLSLKNGALVQTVSSNFAGAENDQTWGANSAIDGSANSAWSSAGDGDEAYIEIALAQAEHIDHIQVWSRFMSDGSAKILRFKITLDDGEVLGPFTLPDTRQAYQFAINRTSSTVRLDVETSTGGNTGLIEFSAYSQP